MKAPSLVTYADDGAGDATVTEFSGDAPIPEVAAVVRLGAKAIPLLIQCLDDPRPSTALFLGNLSWRVPVGHICLDILLGITDPPGVSVQECADDGLGACVNDGYYFRPDAYVKRGDRYIPKPEVSQVKRNWQRLHQAGKVQFVFPQWWPERFKDASIDSRN